MGRWPLVFNDSDRATPTEDGETALSASPDRFLAHAAEFGGAAGADLGAVDWAGTSLGPPEQWPPALRAALRSALPSRFAMWLAWGPDLTFFCNDAYRRATLGEKYPWALGRPAREVWAEIWPQIGPRTASVIATGRATWDVALPLFLERSGFVEETYHTFSYSPLSGEDGVVAGMLCVVSEETDRVIAERRMDLLQSLATPEGAVGSEDAFLDHIGRRLAADPRALPFCAVYLLDDQLDSRPAFRLAGAVGIAAGHPAAPALFAPGDGPWPAAEAMASGSIVVDDLAARFGDLPTGAWDAAPCRAVVAPLSGHGSDGPAGVLVAALSPYRPPDLPYLAFVQLVAAQIAAGIASARAYETQRRRAEQLAELDAAKTAFFTNISHEFRTPLTLMLGPLGDVLTDSDDHLTQSQRDRLELVERNADRLLRLVNRLLDFSRLVAGHSSPRLVALDLAAETAELSAAFRPAFERAGLTLDVRCEAPSFAVHADREMWAKIVGNLLSNALKFTFAGGVTVRLRGVGAEIELSVADTGVGIAAVDQPRLFERFHRAHAPRARTHEGSGIGLALVADLAALHGGGAGVVSAPGVGTTVTVRIASGAAPADTGPAGSALTDDSSGLVASRHTDGLLAEADGWLTPTEPTSGPTARERDAGPRPSDARGRVLVVDDNADMRAYAAGLLSTAFDVRTAADGEAALAAALADPPDLVLTDVMMAGLDGFDLLAALRADRRTSLVPVVMLSAQDGEAAAVHGLEAGADDYLAKPFSAAELIARVQSNLLLARLRSTDAAWRRLVVDAIQDAVAVIDGDGVLLDVNDAFRDLLGISELELPREPPHPWWPDPDTEPEAWDQVQDALRQVLSDGRGRLTVPLTHSAGHRIWAEIVFGSLGAPGHGHRVIVGTLRDVTDRRLATERAAALSRMTTRLAEITDVETLLADGARELAAALGAARAAVARIDPDGTPRAIEAAMAPDQATAAPLRAVAEKGALHVRTGDDGLASGIGAPVESGDSRAAVWLELTPPRRLSPDERSHFLQLCAVVSHAVLRAEAFDLQRTVALALQRALLGPADLPPGFAVRYSPAVRPLEVGGDWYDVVELGADTVGVVVGDCIGKGLEAATVMGQLRSACRALLLQAKSPAAVLEALDDFAALIPDAACTSVFAAVIDQVSGEVRYSAAGHPPAVIVHGGGASELLDGAHSVPLASVAVPQRPEAVARLRLGSVLTLYTDGLVERRGEHLDVGIGRLTAALRAAHGDEDDIAGGVLADVLPPEGQQDDVAVLVYRHRNPTPFSAALAVDPAALAPMRRDLRAWLAESGAPDPDVDAVLIAAGEACANALEHGYGFEAGRSVELHATIVAGRLELIITDRGGWKAPMASENRGRGRGMMEQLMDSASIEGGPDGTIVRLRKELGRDR